MVTVLRYPIMDGIVLNIHDDPMILVWRMARFERELQILGGKEANDKGCLRRFLFLFGPFFTFFFISVELHPWLQLEEYLRLHASHL